jgi:hypothetical protein
VGIGGVVRCHGLGRACCGGVFEVESGGVLVWHLVPAQVVAVALHVAPAQGVVASLATEVLAYASTVHEMVAHARSVVYEVVVFGFVRVVVALPGALALCAAEVGSAR